MSLSTAYGRRIAQEAQLLAEERWIVDALKKIRTQRNCLQIERLQLENMISLQKYGPINKPLPKETPVLPTDSPVTNEDNTNPQSIINTIDPMSIFATFSRSNDQPSTAPEADVSNFEELNLSVTNPVWSNINDPLNFNIEMEEEYDEETEDEGDNINIDMNMFMNADQADYINMDS